MRRLISNSANIHRVVFGVIVVCVLGTAANGTPWEGNGTAEQPYLIFDACDMQAIGADSNYWDAHFKLMADIDLSAYTGSSFNIIGGISPDPCLGYLENPFTGVFDGNGHTISNFTYISSEESQVAMFGAVDDFDAEIKNLGLINPYIEVTADGSAASLVCDLEEGKVVNCYIENGVISALRAVGGLVVSIHGLGIQGGVMISNCHANVSVSGFRGVGGLVGYSGWGTISDYYTTGDVFASDIEVGGLVGRSDNNKISNSYSSCTVMGKSLVGGLVGISIMCQISESGATGIVTGTGDGIGGLVGYNRWEGTISSCYATGEVNGVFGERVGGLAGYNESDCKILNSYANGNVSGEDKVGGLVGENMSGKITHCYSTGSVSGDDDVGGLIGDGHGGYYTRCFWNKTVNPLLTGIGSTTNLNGVTGETTANMQRAITFAGWSCDPVWTIDEGMDYPRLWWQNLPGELIINGRWYGGGNGEPNNPYLIYTAEQMNAIGLVNCDLDKHFRLMADIDLSGYSGTEFNIIGKFVGVGSSSNTPFIGGFDGAGHTISNFTYRSNGNYVGIFGYIDGSSVIQNLGLIDPNVDGGDHVAPLVARHYGTVTNCYAKGGIVSGNISVGGLVGNCLGEVSRCYSTASVVGEGAVGGLAGVTADADVGGPAGKGKVLDCYSWGDISGGQCVGGLVGWNYESLSSYPAEISNCYAAGSVFGDSDVGGLIGKNGGDAYNCFWDVNSSGQSSSAGGEGKTTVEMQTMSTFTDAGWDFVGEVINGLNDIWAICDGTNYPKLSWQRPPVGDFVCPDGVEINDLAILCGQWLLEELGGDVWPEGGDGIVNFFDWAVFADQWQITVDFDDLADFAGQWLKRGVTVADIAPTPDGDGIVNMLDFAALADNWLEGY